MRVRRSFNTRELELEGAMLRRCGEPLTSAGANGFSAVAT